MLSPLTSRTETHHSRRRFLQAAAAAGVGLTATTLSAIEPMERVSKSHFKFSLAAYSYRKLLQGAGAELTLVDFIHDCAKMGLDGTELTSYYFPEQLTTEYLRMLKRECFLQGLDISGTAVRNDFGFPAGAERTKWLDHLKAWIEHSEVMGAPVIRIFAGHQQKGVSEAETHRLMVDGIAECCEHAAKHGVYLALENHGGPTATAEGLLKIVKDVDSPWFGVNLDTGNFRSDRVYEELAAAAPYALNVQVKAAVSDANRKKRPADYARIGKILKDANYSGYVVLEYEEAGDPRVEAPKQLDLLRAALA